MMATATVTQSTPRRILAANATSIVFIVAVCVIGAASTTGFVSDYNLQMTLAQLVPLAMLTIGAAVAMHGGVVDLSVASTFGLGGMTYASVLAGSGSLALAIVCGLGAGITVGLFNAVISVRFRIEPLIATLGMYIAARGLVRVLGSGQSVSAYRPAISAAIEWSVLGVPLSFVILVVLAILLWAALQYTRWGRHIVASGGNDSAARRAGVRTTRLRVCLFVVAAGVAAFAGILGTAQVGSAPVNLGEGYELQVYAALLIAGYRLTGGGKGNPVTGLVSLAALMLLLNIFRLHGLPLPLNDVLLGGALLIAMIVEISREGGMTAVLSRLRRGTPMRESAQQ